MRQPMIQRNTISAHAANTYLTIFRGKGVGVQVMICTTIEMQAAGQAIAS
jgi:hypothetical protein